MAGIASKRMVDGMGQDQRSCIVESPRLNALAQGPMNPRVDQAF
jgi:hypothetical protein